MHTGETRGSIRARVGLGGDVKEQRIGSCQELGQEGAGIRWDCWRVTGLFTVFLPSAGQHTYLPPVVQGASVVK